MSDESAVTAGPLRVIRNASVFLSVVVALFLVRFFQAILAPLVIATLLLLLADALSRILQRRLPAAPRWVRGTIAVAVILIAFAAIGVLFAVQAPPFADEIKGLEPRLDGLLAKVMTSAGAPPIKLRQMLGGLDPGRVLGRVFVAARGLISYGVLVIIYFGFLRCPARRSGASWTAFSRARPRD